MIYSNEASIQTGLTNHRLVESPIRFKARPQPGVKPLRVLVVDDDTAIRLVLVEMWAALGCHAEGARNGLEALERFSEGEFDLILTDLNMPVMDGFGLTRRVRNSSTEIKIVVMTGLCPDEVEEMMSADRVDAWLFKPFGMREIRRLHQRFQP